MIIDQLRIVRWSAATAWADFRAMYTWKTWTFGWLARVICQVLFFTLIGRLVGSDEVMWFLLVGNTVFVGASTALLVIQSSTWERMSGTLPLLLVAPAHPLTVFAGRSVQWLVDGLAVSTISLLVVGWLLGFPVSPVQLLVFVPLMAVVLLSVYSFGLVLAAFVLRHMHLRNVIANVAQLSLMVLCGVLTPVEFWPVGVEHLSSVLPMTHGLLAIRSLLGGGGVVGEQIAWEALVGLSWFVVAALLFRHLAEGGRRNGSIEFGD